MIVVQLGDMIGRSHEERAVLDFIFAIEKKAAIAGGKVHVVIGNHEVFGARVEIRNVAEKAYATYEDIPGQDLENSRLAHLETHQRARSAALMPGGYYASQLARFPAVLLLGNTVFAHGGVTPHWANYGVGRINAELGQWLAGGVEEPLSTKGLDRRKFDASVMMSRHFSQDVGAQECAMLDEALRILGAVRMVVAHTVHDSITSRCNEKAWNIDVGMSRYYGGTLQVLEIVGDEVIAISR